MRVLVVAALGLGCGCGRVGFDPLAGATGDGSSGGGDGASVMGLQAVDCASPAPPEVCGGLVALLHFDNDAAQGETALLAHDFSGHQNHATCTSGTCPTFVPGGGRFGGAFAYTDPQAFAIANAPSVSITGAVTMSAWFYPNTLATSWRIVITKIQATPLVANYGIPHNGANLCVNFCTQAGGWMNHCTATSYTPGRWYHLVGVIDNTQQRARLYVDGVRVVDDAEPAMMEQDGGSVWIGWSPTNLGVDGRIDEVAIGNRALSDVEIAALY